MRMASGTIHRTIGIRADSIPYRDYTNIMKNGIKNTIILEKMLVTNKKETFIQGVPRNMTVARRLEGRLWSLK